MEYADGGDLAVIISLVRALSKGRRARRYKSSARISYGRSHMIFSRVSKYYTTITSFIEISSRQICSWFQALPKLEISMFLKFWKGSTLQLRLGLPITLVPRFGTIINMMRE